MMNRADELKGNKFYFSAGIRESADFAEYKFGVEGKGAEVIYDIDEDTDYAVMASLDDPCFAGAKEAGVTTLTIGVFKTLIDYDFCISGDALNAYRGTDEYVVIPPYVKKIGSRAFVNRYDIKEVKLPPDLEEVSDLAFSDCGIKKIVFCDDIKIIGREILKNCLEIEELEFCGKEWHGSKTAFRSLASRYNIKIRSERIDAVPPALKYLAAEYYLKMRENNQRFETDSYDKYFKKNISRLIPLAMDNKLNLEYFMGKKLIDKKIFKKFFLYADENCKGMTEDLLCYGMENKLFGASDIEKYFKFVSDERDANMISSMLRYSRDEISEKDYEKAERKSERDRNIVLERLMARADKEGIEGLNFAVAVKLFSFESRAALKTFIEEKGGKLQTAVTLHTDYLINNGAMPDNPNVVRAEELGIESITENRFNELAGRDFIIMRDELLSYRGEEEIILTSL